MVRISYRWEQTPHCDDGMLTLWPGTAREIQFPMPSLKLADALATLMEDATTSAFEEGRASFKAQVSKLEV